MKKQTQLLFTSHQALGSDPEFFFVKDNKVVPSSEVISDDEHNDEDTPVIRDGFQGELNPSAHPCRQVSGAYVGRALLDAVRIAKRSGATISLDVGHIISDDVWKKTSTDMKRFGCNPTLTAYRANAERVTGLREKFRAGGGHLHFGLANPAGVDCGKLVKVMDIVVGNTCVLFDRDINNARRRKNYGRAGEYRLKSYGVEYRVLSNFWLRSYTLWSMVTALGRNAIGIYTSGLADELIAKVDMRKIRKAINYNDYDLALKNFTVLKEFLVEHNATGNGLDVVRLKGFTKWATSEQPLEEWNTMDKVIKGWTTYTRGQVSQGLERYLDNNYDNPN